MTDDAQWMAAGMFSPSKARQQEAQARDWQLVDDWLQRKYYANQIPVFERNADTLRALLDLMYANEKADDRRSAVWDVEHAAMDEMLANQRATAHLDTIYAAIEATLQEFDDSSWISLSSQSEAALSLNCSQASRSAIGTRIINLGNEQFDLSTQIARTEDLRKTLASEQIRLERLLEEIRRPDFNPSSSQLHQTTTELNQQTKDIKASLRELGSQVSEADDQTVTSLKVLLEAQQEHRRLQSRFEQVSGKLSEPEQPP